MLNEISAKSREFQAIFDRCLDTVENEKQEIVLLRDMVMKLQMQMVGVSDDGSSLAALHEKYLSLENEFLYLFELIILFDTSIGFCLYSYIYIF